MRRIDLTFENLRPIATYPHLRCTHAGIGSRRKGWRLEFAHLGRRTHIGPHKTARLTRGVGFVLNPFRNEAGGRLGRHFHDVAVHVEFPAMIEATKTALLIAGEYQ